MVKQKPLKSRPRDPSRPSPEALSFPIFGEALLRDLGYALFELGLASRAMHALLWVHLTAGIGVHLQHTRMVFATKMRARRRRSATGPAWVRPGPGGRFLFGFLSWDGHLGRRAAARRPEWPSYLTKTNEKSTSGPRPYLGRTGGGVYFSGP